METSPRDSAPEKLIVGAPRGYHPCTIVVFNQLTSIPGLSTMYTEVRAGATRIAEGKEVSLPIPFINPEFRTVWISGREYPMERVHYWERAKTAFIKPEGGTTYDYTIGKKKRNTNLASHEPHTAPPSK